MALICPGVPLIDCAIIRPRVSNSPQAKILAFAHDRAESRANQRVLLLVATDMKRFQITSSVTGSIALFSIT